MCADPDKLLDWEEASDQLITSSTINCCLVGLCIKWMEWDQSDWEGFRISIIVAFHGHAKGFMNIFEYRFLHVFSFFQILDARNTKAAFAERSPTTTSYKKNLGSAQTSLCILKVRRCTCSKYEMVPSTHIPQHRGDF